MYKNILKARIIAEHRGLYIAKVDDTEFSCKVTGKQMYEASGRDDYPAVGDWVDISPVDNENAVIRRIHPRKTTLRKGKGVIASNVDTAFIVESLDRDFSLNRFERYVVLVRDGGITPVLILNKIDTLSTEELEKKVENIKGRFPHIDVILTSTVTREGLDDLKKYIQDGMVYCFLGSSGVGKSSLINSLLNSDEIKTREVSMSSRRGKHTTTTREIYHLPSGGLLIDTPGTREVGIDFLDISDNDAFGDIQDISKSCKYKDCTHIHEPGCAVLEAVEEGKLDSGKYENYSRLRRESEYYELDKLERRDKDKKFGKFIKNSKRDKKSIEDHI